jgi:hypothetical protein
MPAANLLTDEGNIATMVQREAVLATGAQHVGSQGSGMDEDNNAHIHCALILLLAVMFIVLLRKNGFHALMVEG